MVKNVKVIFVLFLCSFAVFLTEISAGANTRQNRKNAMEQQDAKKMVFIHHSVGGHWLAHAQGGLVAELNRKGFYVNDITYGWQPSWVNDSLFKKTRNKIYSLLKYNPRGAYLIGDRTDIGHFYDWFIGPDSQKIMESVYAENNETKTFGDHANTIPNPGLHLENDIVMIKPCYPNTLYRGNAGDPATPGANPPRNFEAGTQEHTVANAKRIYNDILQYIKQRPDKFFIMVTAPPRMELPQDGAVARSFSNWLVHDWLKENKYQNKNVMVFDLFNVLTSGPDWTKNDLAQEEGNHHRMWNGEEQHIVQTDKHVLVYPRNGDNNHPSKAGLEKASKEFVDLFVYRYNKWLVGGR